MLHLGMIVVGLPYTFQEQMGIDEINGVTPFGAATITGQKGERKPSDIELAAARFQGKHVASIASKLRRR
jgi:NAD(P)H dehydrogenase (quinone)